MKHLLIAFLINCLSACGSVFTLVSNDEAIERSMQKRQTYCVYLPRIYSGVAYDFCALHAEPGGYIIDVSYPGHFYDRGQLVWLGADFLLSGVIDTAALPYTFYQQSNLGSIELGE